MSPRRLQIIFAIFLALIMPWSPISTAAAQENGPGQPTAQEDKTPQQPEVEPVDVRFESPQATMLTYLKAMNTATTSKDSRQTRDAIAEAVSCLDLTGLPQESAQTLAVQLLEVLNRIEKVQAWSLPDRKRVESQSLASFTYFPTDDRFRRQAHQAVLRVYPSGKIDLQKMPGGEWRFAASTLENIHEFRRGVDPLQPKIGDSEIALTIGQRIRASVPLALRRDEVFTLEYWQWIGLLLVIFGGIVLDFTVRLILSGIWRRQMARRKETPDKELLRRAVRPFGLFAAAWVWLGALQLLNLPPQALMILLAAVRVFLMFSAVWAAYRVTDLIAEFFSAKARATSTKVDDLLVPLLRKTAKVFVTTLGMVYIADALNIEILPLLTGLGIGGLAFAFAAKDTIENFFGSIAVIVDRPFEVGDWVVIGDVEGTVEELGFRSTRIRTFYNSLVSVPNATLVRATVDNYGRRRYRRFKTHLGITYDTSPDKVEAFCSGIRELILVHPYTRKDYYHVWLNQFGPSSLDVLVYMFHETPEWATELRERHRFMLDVMRLADKLGVEFAFPTQTLHLMQEDPNKPHEPGPVPSTSAETSAQRKGRQAVREITKQTIMHKTPPPPVTFAGKRIDDEPDDDSQIESRVGGDG